MCGFNVVICGIWPVFPRKIEANLSPDQQHWGWLWTCLVVLRSAQFFGKYDFISGRPDLAFEGFECDFYLY